MHHDLGRDLWPPSVGHRVVVKDTGRAGTIRDIVMDAGEAKYRVALEVVANEPQGPGPEEGLFALDQLDPYFPP